MKAYVIRRVLLMFPTLIGISLIVFALIQFVPGGPVEELISKVHQAASEKRPGAQISPQEVANIKAYFGFDKPAPVRYAIWLGKVARLDLGKSYTYQEPVWDVIKSKFPISLFFGISSFIVSYLISIPLGVAKALRNGTWFDSISSALIFTGFVIPGYALGIILIIFLGGGRFLDWFPISGIISDDFESLPVGGQILDFLHHMVLPLFCYMIGEFAVLTMMLKNSLMDEMGKDYMRTAVVKGSTFRKAVWRHAFRNALIPLATRAGEIFTLMFAGSILIERVFDIDGMGLLVYTSMVNRDYNVVMGIIMLSSFMAMIGRLFSDLLYVSVDPRIRLD
ncbi:MAG: putative transporter, permease protein [Fibrobacteres bacterium]|nr:putative transporter, permease protein [Fibrobacterota bacterium]